MNKHEVKRGVPLDRLLNYGATDSCSESTYFHDTMEILLKKQDTAVGLITPILTNLEEVHHPDITKNRH